MDIEIKVLTFDIDMIEAAASATLLQDRPVQCLRILMEECSNPDVLYGMMLSSFLVWHIFNGHRAPLMEALSLIDPEETFHIITSEVTKHVARRYMELMRENLRESSFEEQKENNDFARDEYE